jgi:hypothetical protein
MLKGLPLPPPLVLFERRLKRELEQHQYFLERLSHLGLRL